MSIGAAVEGGRRLVEATFLDRCVVLDKTDVPDGSGGTETTYLPRALDVACRFAQLVETDVRVIAGSAYGPATAVLQVSLDVDAPEGAYVQNTAVDDGGMWLIVGDRTPPSNTAIYRRLMVREATWVGSA